MTIDFNQLSRDIWPLGTPTATGREPELYDYALGGLDLQLTELERRTNLACRQAAILLDYARCPERYETTE